MLDKDYETKMMDGPSDPTYASKARKGVAVADIADFLYSRGYKSIEAAEWDGWSFK